MALCRREHAHCCAEQQSEDDEDADGLECAIGALADRCKLVHAENGQDEQDENYESYYEANEELDAGAAVVIYVGVCFGGVSFRVWYKRELRGFIYLRSFRAVRVCRRAYG
jgi:hypothetical protein